VVTDTRIRVTGIRQLALEREGGEVGGTTPCRPPAHHE
jgi:hypothetical protein